MEATGSYWKPDVTTETRQDVLSPRGRGRLTPTQGDGEGDRVAVAMLLEWPGADEQAYLSLLTALDLGDRMFTGAVLHLAGPTDGGWRAVDVWESPEAFDRFRSEKLDAAMAQVGLPAPRVDVWPVFALATPQGRPTPQP